MAGEHKLDSQSYYALSIRNTRRTLLSIIIFTAINIVLSIVKVNGYFLFSAFIPYMLTTWGMFFSGLYPASYYAEYEIEPLGAGVFVIFLAIALVILLLYFFSWLFSKKKMGWFIFALVFFALDTAAMFFVEGFHVENILDIIFHVWVIISLSMGIRAYVKLKRLPPEAVVDINAPASEKSSEEPSADSPILRTADLDVKSRSLVEAEVPGYYIVYRRVKSCNELVVNGRVYDEYVKLIEQSHILSAQIDGHRIEAGCNSLSGKVFINFDGQNIANKVRLW